MLEQHADNFITRLAALIGEEPLREKWVIAPSIRIGYQWLDRVARAGQPVFNTHVKTLGALALEIAGPILEKRGKTYINADASRLIIAVLLKSSMEDKRSYFVKKPIFEYFSKRRWVSFDADHPERRLRCLRSAFFTSAAVSFG